MTAKISSAFDYGMHEMSGLYRRHASIALMIAIAVHLMLVSLYYLLSPLFPAISTDIPPNRRSYVIDVKETFLLPPAIGYPGQKSLPKISQNLKFANPKPVSIDESTLKNEFAAPGEIQETVNERAGDGTEGGVLGDEGTGTGIGEEIDPPPFEFQAVEKLPVPVKQVSPEYPAVARLAGMEGTVWLKVLVDKQGRSKKAIVWKSDAEVFDGPAMRAALQWVYTPAMMNSGPVAVWVSIPFRFRLNN